MTFNKYYFLYMEPVDNIFPKVQKRFIHASERSYISFLRNQADSICRGTISEAYIKKAFNSFKNGYIYSYPEHSDPIGFCIWKIKKTDSVNKINKQPYSCLYIYLICAKQTDFKLARLMFYDLEEYCQNNGIDYIQLQPANEKLQKHYQTFGFTLTDSLNIIMTKPVKKLYIARSKTRKIQSSKKKNICNTYNTVLEL